MNKGWRLTGWVLGTFLWVLGAFLLVFFLFWLTPYARAQEKPVTTLPLGVSSSNVSTTVTVTDTFQSVFAVSTTQRGRTNCTIVNYGTHTMWVFEDATAAGVAAANVSVTTTKGKSVQLAANQAYYCAQGGTTIKSAVFIAGTSGDAFYAAVQ